MKDAREAIEVFARCLEESLATRASAMRRRFTSTTDERDANAEAAGVLDDAAMAVANALREFKDAIEQDERDPDAPMSGPGRAP